MTLLSLEQHELQRRGEYDRNRDDLLGPNMIIAASIMDAAWQILSKEIGRLGYEAERPVFENQTVSCRYEGLKSDALEMSDSVYFSLPEDLRRKEDSDLEVLEVTRRAPPDASGRIIALSALNAAKSMIGDGDL